ncbi:MAG: sigma-70 family RNA polymerase sigma factor [Xanthomonadales bacterium]
MRERSDEDLVAEWSGGSMAAFEQLYARYRAPLYRYFLRLVGDATRANDLYQGCWEKVIRARGRYRPSGPFRAWLFRIAHNHAMDGFRRAEPVTELDEAEVASTRPDPVAHTASAERAARLAAALDELPPEQREAVLLKLEAGLDLETIARVTGVGRETAKSRLRYATKRLRRALSGEHTE